MTSLLERYLQVRRFTETLAAPLCVEDQVVQTMPDVSPTKWHRAHTTWFFETFILKAIGAEYRPHHPQFEVLFNSYYNAVGPQFPRALRGSLSRPTVSEVGQYREHVDAAMAGLLEAGVDSEWASLVEVGLHHEQQHQELLLTDIKHVLGQNPLYPPYRDTPKEAVATASSRAVSWRSFEGGIVDIGAVGTERFTFDNETPRHRALIRPYQMADRLVTNGEYLEFMTAGGYETPALWLSDGWATIQSQNWSAPLYWTRKDGDWFHFTLDGLAPVDPAAPVCHVSFYEADAFATWADARLPTEQEWEVAATQVADEAGNFVDDSHMQPRPVEGQNHQMFGDVWEWTSSPYVAYPGFSPVAGALGEYNGKFMCNQLVLRGGSCATSRNHIRTSYRNFFFPQQRWQFMGIRLAREV